jgi:protoporphyrinogen oxidase
MCSWAQAGRCITLSFLHSHSLHETHHLRLKEGMPQQEQQHQQQQQEIRAPLAKRKTLSLCLP